MQIIDYECYEKFQITLLRFAAAGKQITIRRGGPNSKKQPTLWDLVLVICDLLLLKN